MFSHLRARLALFPLLLSLALSAGEDDTPTLRAEIRAIRNAYESRISELESQVKDLRADGGKTTTRAVDDALAKKSPADKALTAQPPPLHAAGSAIHSSSRVTIGGYSEFAYIDRGNRAPEFNQTRTVLELGASLNERIKFYLEWEHENGATIEGENTSGEWELEQGYLDFSIVKQFNFRAGMMLVPVGRYNLYHEPFLYNHVDRPLVDRWVLPTTWFEEGVGFHGDLFDSKFLGISYESGIFNPGNPAEANSDLGFREIRNEGKPPAFRGKSGAMRVAFEPARNAKWFADNLELGVSGYLSNYSSPDFVNPAGDFLPVASGAFNVAALDLTYERRNFGFRAEAATSHTGGGSNEDRRPQSARGFYTEAYYSWKPCIFECGPLAKSWKDQHLIFSTRFDWVELNPARDDSRDLKRVTVGVSYRPLHQTVVKLDYQMDFSHSGLTLDSIPDSGKGKRTDAILFGVSTGF